MKRQNHETDLKLYKLVFNYYYSLISEIENSTGFELEDLKQEKDIFRPNRNETLPKEYLKLCDKVNLGFDKVTIETAGFRCSFRYVDVITIKRLIERKLVTPKHHLYYVDVKETSEAA